MKLEKAIEILEDIVDTAHYSDYPDDHGAIRLGIEALKEIEHLHASQVLGDDELLPGETKP